jgi:hypothetical protein
MKHFARIIVILAVAFVCVDAFACPGCKEALMSPDGKPTISLTAQGFGWSIIFMLAVVHTLIALVTYKVYKIIRAEEARPRNVVA